jgi:D-alanyl-D-alanine carboxypeptidase/D-alanyl-D-alanine-endopeptidase (penicillin-binding protein 4)
MVNAPEFRTTNWGVLIVDPVANDTLYALNATKLFIPASNQKLVSSSVMLEQLGPDYRFRTVIAARGPWPSKRSAATSPSLGAEIPPRATT